MKVKMSFSPVMCYFLLFILLDVAVKSQMSSNSNSHAFIQGDNEVRYVVDIPITIRREFPNKAEVRIHSVDEIQTYTLNGDLKFQPSLLDFKERPLGVPHHEKVIIINKNANKTVHMSSISGSTVHFHSSFFEDKVIPPLGNTSFKVVFLGREAGKVESNLFIHTSEGSFKFQVRGSSVQSPYRLRSLSGVRLPLNASFSPLIKMHNPYSTPLQLVEVYSSGGEFHLELPSGELEGPRHLWEIPAYLTKPIIRVRFHARAQKNHTAYIRLKVNNSEEVLVVPLEVEVGANCGLYSTENMIDFGIGGSHDPPTSVKLLLHNSWKKPIKIQNIISTPVSRALKIDFKTLKVPPESDEPTEVASLTFDWRTALDTGHSSGRIVVKTKQSGHKLVIPYSATVLSGGIGYDSLTTRFRSDAANNPPRTFQLTNNFRIPIVITNITLSKDAKPYFVLSKFEPQILKAGQSAALFKITPSIPPKLTLDSTIVVYTNVSVITIPLLCYDGKLKKVMSHRNDSDLELGTVGSGAEKQVMFALVNENPVPVTLLSMDTSLLSTTVTIACIHSGRVPTYLGQFCPDNETTRERSVEPGQHAVVRLHVRAGALVGDAIGEVVVRTEYENVRLVVHMRVEHGSLQVTPDPIIFHDCFPGKVCMKTLRVQSLFSVAMAVTGVSAVPGDSRISFTPVSPPVLLPASTTDLGTISFNPNLLSKKDNYLTSTHNVTGATRWQDTLELPAFCPDYDLRVLAARYDIYRNLSSRLLNISLRLDTTEVQEHMFGVRVELSWPQLSRDLRFPLTQVGNTTYRTLVIRNPGTQKAVVVQLVLENTYPSAASVLDHLPTGLRSEVLPGAQSGVGEFMLDTSQSLYKMTASHIHRDTWVFLLPPATNTSVRVSFTPKDAQISSILLLLRNNLTVLETVQLSGTGAFTQFKFGNRKPGSVTPLLFDLAEKHLKDCEREKQRKFPAPNLTVKRSFTARNTGVLPISVRGFHISGLPCEGYGFRVLNCEGFNLAPNRTRKVDIAFTPDFTLARVQRTLGVWTSDSNSAANYTLVATLPPFLLNTCSAVLARPPWEPLLYYCAVTFMVFLLVCVLAAAFLESDRALKCALLAMSRDNATVQPVLDLRSIGTGVGLSSSGNSSLLGLDKADSTSVSWTRASAASCSSQEPEVMKEKLLVENVPGVFTNPASKCTKKKDREKTVVSKRYSDPTDGVSMERRSSWGNVFSKPVISPTTKPSAKSLALITASTDPSKLPLPETKRKVSKKNLNTGRAVREVPALVMPSQSVGEDTETSSTTTESSHDDGDKEVEVTMALRDCEASTTVGLKPQRARSNKTSETKKISPPTERNGGSASSLELEWEDEEPAERELIKKSHSNSRSRKSGNKNGKLSENGQIGQTSSRSKNSAGGNKQPSSRTKEKQTLSQKRSFEKLSTMPKPVVFEPPPPPLGLWDDSRASFSDVVARSDSTKQSLDQPATMLHSLTAPQAATPPTVLGPIGSKKTYSSVWDCWIDSGELTSAPPPVSVPTASSSSFFMDTFSDTRPSQISQNTNFDVGWSEPDPILKMLQAEEQRRIEAEKFQSRSVYQDTWSLWEPASSGATSSVETSNPSLWGNDVWAPPPPPDTWAPPGLAPRPPPRLDDTVNPELDIGLDYDPFRSLSNIWAPHTPTNFWKPPTTNNN